MEKKEEIKVKDKAQYLKELREMTEVSLSHTPPDDYDDTLKLLKAFFGEYFGIPDEYTFSELREKVLQSGIKEDTKEKIIKLTDTIDKILYTKEELSPEEVKKIKDNFFKIMNELVPMGSVSIAEKKPSGFLSIFKDIKSLIPKRKFEKKQDILEENVVEKELPLINKEEKVLNNIPAFNKTKERLEEVSVKEEETSEDKELEEQINKISGEFQKLKEAGVNNPFLELEFKSLLGDYKIYQLNQNPELKDRISIKINKFSEHINHVLK